MRFLSVVLLIVPFIYFGYLMSRLDRYLSENALRVGKDNNAEPVAIVFGETDLAKQTAKLLEKGGIKVLTLNEPFILEQEKNFRYMLALSEKDVDNIVICKIGKKLYNIEKVISLCNDRNSEAMFISEKICYLSREVSTAELIYQTVMKERETK